MKSLIIFLSLIYIPLVGQSQDYIYMKDKSIQMAKILEVTIDKVKFKKFEILSGPSYEILKSEIIKIRYSNGFTDIIDKASLSDTLNAPVEKNKHDSVNYSIVYIVFNDGYDQSQTFPIYFNGRHIQTIRNHMRIACKLFSEGILTIERRSKKSYVKIGPKLDVMIEHGKFFGVSIDEPYPQALSSNKKFSLRVVNDSTELMNYLVNEFNGFKPYKKEDHYFQEDPSNPIIK